MQSQLSIHRGFSLVEVLLALAVASFGLIFTIGMLPTGIKTNQGSSHKTTATSIATDVANQLSVIPLNSANPYQFHIPSAGGASASQTLFVTEMGTPTGPLGTRAVPSALYRVTVLFAPPRGAQKTATPVRILVTWPAMADPDAGTLPQHQEGAVEVITALDRN